MLYNARGICVLHVYALYTYNNYRARLYSSFYVRAITRDIRARLRENLHQQCNEKDAGIIADYFWDDRIKKKKKRKSADPRRSCMPELNIYMKKQT